MKILVVLALCVLRESSGALINCNETVTKLRLCSLTPNYAKGQPDKRPLELVQSVTLQSLAEFSEDGGTITANLLVATVWNDTRLTLKSNDPNETLGWYPVGSEGPDVFFPTLKVRSSKGTTKERKYGPLNLEFYWFHYPHRLEYQEAFKATLYCPFDFSNFPFDSHECSFRIGASAGINLDMVRLTPSKIRFKDQLSLLGEKAIKVEQSLLPFDVWIESMEPFVHFEAGFNYSYAGMKIRLERNSLGLLMGGFYGPTLVFSVLSLISFTINPDVVPGRLGLLVTLDLIASNVYNSVKGPDKRGFSYIEIWNIGVQTPILLAIFEYAFILGMKKYYKQIAGKRSLTRVQSMPQAGSWQKHGGGGNSTTEATNNPLDIDSLASKIDAIAFIGSLCFIIIFNIFYWLSI